MRKFLSDFAFDMRQLLGLSLEYVIAAAERGLCRVDGHRWELNLLGERYCPKCGKNERL